MLFGGKRNWGETRISTNALEDWDVAEVGCVHAPARSACQENQVRLYLLCSALLG